jgi:hypothetical protein
MRACIDWPSGEGAVTSDAEAFLRREGLDRQEVTDALARLQGGHTYNHPRQLWSLTPMPERAR